MGGTVLSVRWLPNLLHLILMRKLTSHLGYWKNKHDSTRVDRNKRRAAGLVLTLWQDGIEKIKDAGWKEHWALLTWLKRRGSKGSSADVWLLNCCYQWGRGCSRRKTLTFLHCFIRGNNRIYHSSIFLCSLEHFDPQKILFPSTSYPYFLGRF